MTPRFDLLETMRWEGGVALLDGHLARLRDAAAAFGRPYDEARVRAALAEATAALPLVPHRLRLRVDTGGRPTVEATPLDPADVIRTAAVYPERLPSGGPFWRHKTTHRPHYDRALAWARAHGADEPILVNPRGGLVEGARTSVWVERGGRLLTPPLAAGGLPGVYRQHVLATRPDAAEAALGPADLASAEAVWLSNAVRGLFRVRLAAGGTDGR